MRIESHQQAMKHVMAVYHYISDHQHDSEREMLAGQTAEAACHALYEALADNPEKCADGAADCHDRAQAYQEAALAEQV